jgi:hypothetical protein
MMLGDTRLRLDTPRFRVDAVDLSGMPPEIRLKQTMTEEDFEQLIGLRPSNTDLVIPIDGDKILCLRLSIHGRYFRPPSTSRPSGV